VNADHEIETQIAAMVAYLRAELGYDGEHLGNLRRQLEENTVMIRAIDQTLRGQGDELGWSAGRWSCGEAGSRWLPCWGRRWAMS
jgi:hypothetical protein